MINNLLPRNHFIDNLIDALLLLQDKAEARKFLRDLLTTQEILELARRWEAAQLLNAAVPYSIIEKQTGLSSTTVARISKWLNQGAGGYQLMFKKIKHHPHIHKRES